LGATKLETVWKIALPLASPGILTGIIMAMARGAGEVAPLLLVGAIKFAPLLPIDNQFPFIHLERQFMHLGSLIYHGTFNSLETEFGGSMIYVACMLLLLLVLCLNLIAMSVRNKLRLRYSTQGNE
jgi:phosphate transport system permease protein